MTGTALRFAAGIMLVIGAFVLVAVNGAAKIAPFPATHWLAKTVELAHARQATLGLIEATATHVTPDGLVREPGGHLLVRFRESDSKPGSNGDCAGVSMNVVVRHSRYNEGLRTDWKPENQQCRSIISGLPRCSFEQVWLKAKAKGAPDFGYADIDLAIVEGSGANELHWTFELVPSTPGAGFTAFHAELPDDC